MSDEKKTPVRNLASHPTPFVTTEDLAKYWSVSKRQIHKQIEDGKLPAIRLGPRSLRIPTTEAAKFERQLTNADIRMRSRSERDHRTDASRTQKPSE